MGVYVSEAMGQGDVVTLNLKSLVEVLFPEAWDLKCGREISSAQPSKRHRKLKYYSYICEIPLQDIQWGWRDGSASIEDQFQEAHGHA